jgi:hypothetical protein
MAHEEPDMAPMGCGTFILLLVALTIVSFGLQKAFEGIHNRLDVIEKRLEIQK